MKVWNLLILGSVAVLLTWCAAWPQQRPSSQASTSPGEITQAPTRQTPATPANPTTTEEPSVTPSSPTAKPSAGDEKMKHLTGTLVDANCMAKTLGSEPASAAPTGTVPSTGGAPASQTPHFTPESPDQLQQSGPQAQQSGPQGSSATGPGGRNPAGTAPTYPGLDTGQNPDMNQQQAARMAAAERVDTAAKQCAASASTQQFGLAVSSGEVLRFDNAGDAKAAEALKNAELRPGKKVKAKVTGAVDTNDMLRVASVDIKGKKLNPTSSMAGGAAEAK
jgi:hypothetical protein